MFHEPGINLYARDVVGMVRFYAGLGFRETFRTPEDGTPDHVELVLEGLCLAISSVEAARRVHHLAPNLDGRPFEIVLWSDDTDGDYARLTAAGARSLRAPHDFRGRLRVAWVEDPEGNPVHLVQRRPRP